MAMFQIVNAITTTKVPPSARHTPSLPKKPWALVAYIAGDNGLPAMTEFKISKKCREREPTRPHMPAWRSTLSASTTGLSATKSANQMRQAYHIEWS